MRRTAILECLAAATLFGLATPATKVLLAGLGPVSAAGWLYLGAALGALPFARRGGSPELRRDRKNVTRLAAAVVAGGIAAPVLLLLGLARANASSVALWLNLETAATAVIARLFFREPLSTRGWVAVLLVTLAGALLGGAPGEGVLAPAVVLVALASVGWGLENNLVSVVDGYTPSQITLVKGLAAAAFDLALGVVLEGAPRGTAVAGGLVVGALGYGLSIVLHVAGSQRIGAARAQAVFSAAPFIGMGASWLALGEPVEGLQLAAALVMAGGIALLLTGRHAHAHAHEAMAHTHAHRHDDAHHLHEHEGVAGEHVHPHEHAPLAHDHGHDPDLHHRHEH